MREAINRAIAEAMENDPEMVLGDLAEEGVAVLASSDVEEVPQVSDRILVFVRGRIQTEFDRESADRAKLLRAAS